jgi:hypothetical protein
MAIKDINLIFEDAQKIVSILEDNEITNEMKAHFIIAVLALVYLYDPLAFEEIINDAITVAHILSSPRKG